MAAQAAGGDEVATRPAVPGAPILVRRTAHSIVVKWARLAGATKYNVHVSPYGRVYYSFVLARTIEVSSSDDDEWVTCEIGGDDKPLDPAGTYVVAVSAANAAGESDKSKPSAPITTLSLEEEVLRLRSVINDLHKALAAASANSNNEAVTAANKKVDNSFKRVAEKEEEVQAVRRELTTLRARETQLKAQMAEMNSALEAASAAGAKSPAALLREAVEAAVSTKVAELTALHDERIRKLTARCEDAEGKAEAARLDVEAATARAQSAEDKSREAAGIVEAHKFCKDVEAKLSAAVRGNEALETAHTKLTAMYEELKSTHEALKSTHEEVVAKRDELVKSCTESEAKVAKAAADDTDSKVELLSEAASKMREDIATLQTELETTKQDKQVLTGDVVRLRAEGKAAAATIAELKTQLQVAELKVKEVQALKLDADAVHADLKRALSRANDAEVMAEEATRRAHEMADQVVLAHEAAERARQLAKQALDMKSDSHEEGALAELQGKHTDLQGKHADLQAEHDKLSLKHMVLTTEAEELRKQISVTMGRAVRAEGQYAEVQAQLAQAAEKHATELRYAQEREADLTSAVEALTERGEASESTLTFLQEHVSKLEGRLADRRHGRGAAVPAPVAAPAPAAPAAAAPAVADPAVADPAVAAPTVAAPAAAPAPAAVAAAEEAGTATGAGAASAGGARATEPSVDPAALRAKSVVFLQNAGLSSAAVKRALPALQQLVDMGFPEDKARLAVLTHPRNVAAQIAFITESESTSA